MSDFDILAVSFLVGIATAIVIIIIGGWSSPHRFAGQYCEAKGYETAKDWNFGKANWHVVCEKKITPDTGTKTFIERNEIFDNTLEDITREQTLVIKNIRVKK